MVNPMNDTAKNLAAERILHDKRGHCALPQRWVRRRPLFRLI
jgi:hypothetical protein